MYKDSGQKAIVTIYNTHDYQLRVSKQGDAVSGGHLPQRKQTFVNIPHNGSLLPVNDEHRMTRMRDNLISRHCFVDLGSRGEEM